MKAASTSTHPCSVGDYSGTVFGFLGLATPNFLLALILMFLFQRYFGWSPGGLFSPEYLIAPWSFAKVVDLMKHLPTPLLVIGTAGTAGMIRVSDPRNSIRLAAVLFGTLISDLLLVVVDPRIRFEKQM